MAAQNPKGTSMTVSSHHVKTLAKAQEWWPATEEHHLPIEVEQYIANGRIHVRAYDCKGKYLGSRG